MPRLKQLPDFGHWLEGLKDKTVKGAVLARLARLARGLKGDCSSVGKGVSELRIHEGAGWRVYFTERGDYLVVLLVGGSKRTQRADIEKAQQLAAQLTDDEA